MVATKKRGKDAADPMEEMRKRYELCVEADRGQSGRCAGGLALRERAGRAMGRCAEACPKEAPLL